MSTAVSIAPEFHASLAWVNCDPARLAYAPGRVRLLLFWNASSTYCQTLADAVMRLQARHPNGLSVYAIHLPKFDAELDPALVLKAANRLGLNCPVANDRGWVTWQHHSLAGWPSIVLIDGEGVARHTLVGDQPGNVLENLVSELLGELPRDVSAPTFNRRGQEPRVPLAFPSGLAVSDTHLYVADSGHHRILECTHDGRILRQFGNGQAECMDGGADESAFRFPRGMCLMRDWLYVADSGNHALRRIRLVGGEVATLLGNGRPGATLEGPVENGTTITLNQPWDVVGAADRLYLAQAGCNQIWEYDLTKAQLSCIAGTAQLGIADGPGRSALLAHPAALALVQQNLYVVDAASSSLRVIQLASSTVQTLVGQGLYEFGEQNGQRREARMQYPLGVALDPNSPVLWVADGYNQCLRRLRLGGGEMVRHEIPVHLQLPSALAVGAGALWIADTDAHAVFRLDQASGAVTRLPIGE